jgi:hypothetical protein
MIDRRCDCLRCRHASAAVAAVVFGGLLAGVGCGGSEQSRGARAPGEARSEKVSHEPCGESVGHVDALDTNGDGKPDLQRVTSGGRELCRVVDLNHDGKPDLYEYFDATGSVRRREYCYDETGGVNAIETYEGGRLVHREYDISGLHRIDTWDWFDPNAPLDPKTGRPSHPVRRERDTTGDGQIDQWWTWNGDKVTIAVDRTGDGQPDPETAVVLNPDGTVATAPPPGSGAATDAGAPPPPASAPPAATGAPDGGQS